METSRTIIPSRVIVELSARDLLVVVRDVCRQHGATLEEICGTLRSPNIVLARHEAWWRVRHHPGRHYSNADVSRIFGKAHSTVVEGVRAHARRLAARTDTPKDIPS
jgi:chromosomal replication initiation ATPase DnaA